MDAPDPTIPVIEDPRDHHSSVRCQDLPTGLCLPDLELPPPDFGRADLDSVAASSTSGRRLLLSRSRPEHATRSGCAVRRARPKNRRRPVSLAVARLLCCQSPVATVASRSKPLLRPSRRGLPPESQEFVD